MYVHIITGRVEVIHTAPYIITINVAQNAKSHLLDTESFDNTFGPKSQRKRPNTKAADLQVLIPREHLN